MQIFIPAISLAHMLSPADVWKRHHAGEKDVIVSQTHAWELSPNRCCYVLQVFDDMLVLSSYWTLCAGAKQHRQ